MPAVSPEVLVWARKTAGLSLAEAAEKIPIVPAGGLNAPDRLRAMERGDAEPTRALLVKMAKRYRRALLTFYLSAPPPQGDRGRRFPYAARFPKGWRRAPWSTRFCAKL